MMIYNYVFKRVVLVFCLSVTGLYAKKSDNSRDGLSKYEESGRSHHHEQVVPVETIIQPASTVNSSVQASQESPTNFDTTLPSSSDDQQASSTTLPDDTVLPDMSSSNIPADSSDTSLDSTTSQNLQAPENTNPASSLPVVTPSPESTTNQTIIPIVNTPAVLVSSQLPLITDLPVQPIGVIPPVERHNAPVVIKNSTSSTATLSVSSTGEHQSVKKNPDNTIQQSPIIIPVQHISEPTQTLDSILNQADDSTNRVNTDIKNKLAPYFAVDMFDDTRMVRDLEKELMKNNYSDTLANLSQIGSAGQQLEEGDTALLVEQKNSSTLSLAQEMHLYNRTPGIPFKLLSANLHLFPSIVHAQLSSLREPTERARAMGKIIIQAQDKYDVIVVQEAWDKTCRDIFYNEISAVYKYRVEDNYQSYLSVLQLNIILGSGLAIYSKYPFETLITSEGKQQNYMLQTFSDNRTDQVFTYKGFLIVKIVKQGIPIYIVNTHLAPDSRDWDKFIASEKQPLELVVREMEEIKAVLRFIVMNDYFAQDLQRIVAECESDKATTQSYFKQYIINIGKKIAGKIINKDATNSPRMQCVTDKIKEFSEKTANFWSQAYIFVAGDFNSSTSKDEYKALTETFGIHAQTILPAHKDKLTVVPATTLSYRTDHILSIGRYPVETKSGILIGGSYVSDIFNHSNTRHLALELAVKLEK